MVLIFQYNIYVVLMYFMKASTWLRSLMNTNPSLVEFLPDKSFSFQWLNASYNCRSNEKAVCKHNFCSTCIWMIQNYGFSIKESFSIQYEVNVGVWLGRLQLTVYLFSLPYEPIYSPLFRLNIYWESRGSGESEIRVECKVLPL